MNVDKTAMSRKKFILKYNANPIAVFQNDSNSTAILHDDVFCTARIYGGVIVQTTSGISVCMEGKSVVKIPSQM